MSDVVAVLQEGRRRERAQAFFYRTLAGDADASGDAIAAERLNELLADEQHHVSRLTARLLELGETPTEESSSVPPPELEGWEAVARVREEGEVRWYEEAVSSVSADAETRAMLREILTSERHHQEDLAGKWMPAGPSSSHGAFDRTPGEIRQEDR